MKTNSMLGRSVVDVMYVFVNYILYYYNMFKKHMYHDSFVVNLIDHYSGSNL